MDLNIYAGLIFVTLKFILRPEVPGSNTEGAVRTRPSRAPARGWGCWCSVAAARPSPSSGPSCSARCRGTFPGSRPRRGGRARGARGCTRAGSRWRSSCGPSAAPSSCLRRARAGAGSRPGGRGRAPPCGRGRSGTRRGGCRGCKAGNTSR